MPLGPAHTLKGPALSDTDRIVQQREAARLRANEYRFAYADFKKAMKSASEPLGLYLNTSSPEWLRRKSVLEVLGYAFVGHRRHRNDQPGKRALELAASMPFSVTHWTKVGDLSPAQCEWLCRSFYAEVGTVQPLPAGAGEALSASR